MPTTNETFDPFAFPVARVRFSGPTEHRGGRWFASIRRDSERTYRASSSAEGESHRSAMPAALAAFEKLQRDLAGGGFDEPHIAVPGDLSADSYAFIFVPARYFAGNER